MTVYKTVPRKHTDIKESCSKVIIFAVIKNYLSVIHGRLALTSQSLAGYAVSLHGIHFVWKSSPGVFLKLTEESFEMTYPVC